jgi:hypothetical protein
MPRIGFQSVGRSPPWTSVSSAPMSRRVSSGIARMSSSDEPSQWIGRSMRQVYRSRYTRQGLTLVRVDVQWQAGRGRLVGAWSPVPTPSEGCLDLSGDRNPGPLFGTDPGCTTSRGAANNSPRQTHERRVLHGDASVAFCVAVSRAAPECPVSRRPVVATAGSTGCPAGRPDGPKVSPGLSAGECRVRTGPGSLERSISETSRTGIASLRADPPPLDFLVIFAA